MDGVQFILGRSGTGKTRWCIDAICDALRGGPDTSGLILLVPEQATYQAERAILSDHRSTGFHRLHILSFDRLQFLLLGKNTARPRLSRIGRQMPHGGVVGGALLRRNRRGSAQGAAPRSREHDDDRDDASRLAPAPHPSPPSEWPGV